MTQKEEMGKKNLDEMEHWHWPWGSHTPCWEPGKSSLPSLWLSQAVLVSLQRVQDIFALLCPVAQPGV